MKKNVDLVLKVSVGIFVGIIILGLIGTLL